MTIRIGIHMPFNVIPNEEIIKMFTNLAEIANELLIVNKFIFKLLYI